MIAFERVTFYCRPKDDDGVYHMFPVDSTGKHDTPKRWAEVTTHRYDNELNRYVDEETHEPTVFEFENKGFDSVTIIDLHKRDQGGRAYQVVIEIDGEKFRMDLRENTLMDVIETKGILAGGKLNGTFCLAKDGAQTCIILEGTKTHTRAIEEMKKRKEFDKPIKKSDLKVGYLYETTGHGSSAVFAGYVYTSDVKNNVLGKPYKTMLWISTSSKKLLEILCNPNPTDNQLTDGVYYWNVETKKSHSFKIEKEMVVDDLNISTCISNINRMGKLFYDKKMGTKFGGYGESDYESAILFYKLSTLKEDKKDVIMAQDAIDKIRNKQDEARRNRRW